jgi:hypothetical protein
MNSYLKKITEHHRLLGIYLLVFLLLISGVISVSGYIYVPQLLFYFAAFLMFYALIFYLKGKIKFNGEKSKIILFLRKYVTTQVLVIGSIAAIIVHLILLKSFPAWQAYQAMKLSEVVMIRRAITEEMPSWANYMMSWNMKAVIPFTLTLLFVRSDKKLYWIFFAVAVFYAFVMMQKSFILLVLMPLGFVTLFERKWLYLAKIALTSIVVVFTLSYIQNVTMRGGINDIRLEYDKEPATATGIFGKLFGGLRNRVMIVPGKTVVKWFEHIPKDKPFLKGNGFKIYSKLIGGTYHNYARELYPYVYVENAKHGLVGSVNVASFMRGYSNFGNVGLVFSAFFLSLILICIEKIFSGNMLYKAALNAFPVLMLSSTSLPTTLVSGGWVVSILLFILFKDQFKKEDPSEKSLTA